jgi:hypothetical protein
MLIGSGHERGGAPIGHALDGYCACYFDLAGLFERGGSTIEETRGVARGNSELFRNSE